MKWIFWGILLLLVVPTFSQKSNLVKLAEKVEELKKESEDKQVLIQMLENEVRQLSSQNYAQGREAAKSREAIQEKTEQILVLRNELNSLKFDYQELIEELELSEIRSQEVEKRMQELQEGKRDLLMDLQYTKDKVKKLTDSLENIGKVDSIKKNNEVLQKRISDILNVKQKMFFLEFGGRLPLGFELNLSYGSLLKGKTLFIGLKSGYIGISKTPNSISNSTIRMALLPVSAQIRIPISRRDLGFQYASPFEPIHETAKYFLSIDPGFTIPLSVSAISDYNRGGAMISLGVGGIFNFFESTNAVAYSGIDVQQLRVVNGDFKDTDYFVNFRIGVGANF